MKIQKSYCKKISPFCSYLIFSTIILAPVSSIACEAFYPPKINNVLIDRCAYLGASVSCTQSATEFAANSFCKYKSYSYAKRYWWKDHPWKNRTNNYIARSAFGPNANYEFVSRTGGFRFELILCQ